MEAMNQLLKEGKIRAAGVSNFTPADMEAARKVCPIASNQPPYSMLVRDIEKEVVPYCVEHNIALIVYSPLQRGLLTGKFNPDVQFKDGDHRAKQAHFSAGKYQAHQCVLREDQADCRRARRYTWSIGPGLTVAQPGITPRWLEHATPSSAEKTSKLSHQTVR